MLAGEVLQDRHGRRHQADLRGRHLARQPRGRWPAQPPEPAGDEREGLSQPHRADFRGWSEGQRNGEIIIERDWVKEAAEGLIALSAAKEGEIGHALLDGEEAKAEALLREWMEVFPERFYVEVQRTSRVNDEEHLHAAVALASRCNAPLVATNDVRFIKQEDFEAHETRVCIGEGGPSTIRGDHVPIRTSNT